VSILFTLALNMQYSIILRISLLSIASLVAAASDSSCKCVRYRNKEAHTSLTAIQTPADTCWPSPTVWAALNETLSGRVLPTTLPKSVCPQEGAGSETWVVNASDTAHVQATFQFAREHNLKVNVNNTGHAGPGRYNITHHSDV
jgi:hypothetical protein